MSDSMWDRRGWEQVSCEYRDGIYGSGDTLRPASSLTDLDGRFGEPVVYTEWADWDEVPQLRDYCWPKDDGDRPCEHYVPAPALPGERADEEGQ